MEPIVSFMEVLQYLKDQEILYSVSKGVITYYYQKENVIAIKNPNSHYKISLDEFKDLFRKETFYLYIPKDEGVNTEKDEEYYAWKSRGTN